MVLLRDDWVLMKVNGTDYQTVWLDNAANAVVRIIDQRKLPHEFVIEELRSVDDVVVAIQEMHIRGAPAIGVVAAYGMYLAIVEAGKEKNWQEHLNQASKKLKNSRPTAINLGWAVDEQLKAIADASSPSDRVSAALQTAETIAEDDIDNCKRIGIQGVSLIWDISRRKSGAPVNIMTHCNAGWLACVDYGTATAPIYEAFSRGIPIHVWVSETRPRNQGALLTAWELGQQGVPHTVFVDNAAGILMQKGLVDLILVGSDRTTYTGDVANKVGTYLKALAARDNNIPFYAALPSSTIDWTCRDGVREIPIEERSADEVKFIEGLSEHGVERIRIVPEKSTASNYTFDVTPRELITGLITERGICAATEEGISTLFPERRKLDD